MTPCPPHLAAKPLLAALCGHCLPTVPFWLMRQAGRYLPEYRALRAKAGSFLDLCLDPAAAAEVTLQPVRRFGTDGAILFADILIVPHALGQPVTFETGEGPKLDPIRSAAGLDRLSGQHLLDRASPVLETVRRVKASLPPSVTLLGFAGAPWTVATYMVEGGSSRDFAETKGWAARDPKGFQALIDLLIDSTVEYLSAQAQAGAEAVQLFDSWAGALPDDGFERWVIEPTKAIIGRFKARHPQVPVICFPRGAGANYLRFTEAVSCDALGLDTTVPLAWAAHQLQPHRVLQGNLDPILLAVGGGALAAAAARILETLANGPFVFNLGHGVVPHTPPEHVAALAAQIRTFRRA